MNNSELTVKAALRYGYSETKARFWFFVQALLVYLVFNTIASIVSIPINNRLDIDSSNVTLQILSFSLFIAGMLLSAIASIGMAYIYLSLIGGKPARVSDVYAHAALIWKYIWTSILVLIPQILIIGIVALLIYRLTDFIGLVGALILGLVAVIASVYIGIRLFISVTFLIDNGEWGIPAIKRSWNIMRGHAWLVVRYGLAGIPLVLLGYLTLGLGFFLVIPTLGLAYVYLYRGIADRAGVASGLRTPAELPTPMSADA